MSFWFLQFFQKTNENKWIIIVKSNVFLHFLEELRIGKYSFWYQLTFMKLNHKSRKKKSRKIEITWRFHNYIDPIVQCTRLPAATNWRQKKFVVEKFQFSKLIMTFIMIRTLGQSQIWRIFLVLFYAYYFRI